MDDDKRIGYRDDGLFGDGVTNPLAVAYHEANELCNVDIPEYILDNYPDKLTFGDKTYLKKIVDQIDEMDEIDEWFYHAIIKRVIGDRDFCLWLCKNKRDVYDSYIGIMPQCEETFEESCLHIDEYEIPDDAIILSDGGKEGALYVWKEK